MIPRSTGLALLSLVLTMQAVPARETEPAAAGGAVPQLWMSIRGISPDGPYGAEASVSWNLDRENRALLRVWAGSRELPNLCAVGSGAVAFEPGVLVGWLLEARLLEATANSVRLSLRWSRTAFSSGVIAEADMQREFETTLTEGARSVIDLVRPLGGPAAGCDGVVIQTGFDFADPPELASELLDYDIWLVHREADGREVLDRSAGRGLQGDLVRYLFRQLRYNEQGTPQDDGAVSMEFGGWVRGRIRPDGRIDVSVGANRTVTRNRLGQGRDGEKAATVNHGETLEVELPPYEWNDDNQRAQRTSVRVTVRRIR